MGVFGASRFTAVLAAVAISGMAGTFWWALETRSDMKAAAGNQGATRPPPSKFSGRVTRPKDDRPGKFESNKFELMGKSERPQPGAPSRSLDQDQPDRLNPAPILANYPNPAPASNQTPASSGSQTRSLQGANTQVLSSQSQSMQSPGAPGQGPLSSRGDMPLPALPAMTPLVPAPPEPAPWQARAPDPPMFFPPPLPQPPAAPAEPPRRPAREARQAPAPVARAPKPAAQPSYYMEKIIEQGETRYRRRPCEPPNMPDVCFMPQADRLPIVVAKP